MRPGGRAGVLLAAAALAAAAQGGVIEGRVTLPHRHAAPVLNQRYEIVAHGGILATNPPLAVVYFEPERAGRPAAAPPAAQMAQRGLAFVPALLAVRTGTRVFFPNEDDTFHNIFSYSPAKRFDLGRYRSDERPVPSVVFDRAGLVTLHCDIHEHMRALILVVDTPFFAITEADGHYRLTNVPPGPGVLKVWLDSRTVRAQPVMVPAADTLWRNLP
ncbi:MAG TPA: hypothetical protein VFE31_02005 [Opitutaceae bacterium]|jgi:plastocyanin|nr:hypothetical protein [Opitutaceae bacterium]